MKRSLIKLIGGILVGCSLFGAGLFTGYKEARPDHYTGVLEALDTKNGIGKFRLIPSGQIIGRDAIELSLSPYAQLSRFSYRAGMSPGFEVGASYAFWVERKSERWILRDMILMQLPENEK